MKGVIPLCLGEMVKEKASPATWEDVLEQAGLDRGTSFMAGQDVSDQAVLQLFDLAGRALGASPAEAADAFGDYWVNTFAPRRYGFYYSGAQTAKEFLLKMDKVHTAVTRNMLNARPPQFEYSWRDDRTLLIEYRSERGLIDLLVGLIKGVGRYYGEELAVEKDGLTTVKVVFTRPAR